VTGASRGIGAALACGLADAGAKVIGVGRSAAPEWKPNAALNYRSCDIADDVRFAVLFDDIVATSGGVHILVNAAGVAHALGQAETPMAYFERLIKTNLQATYACCLKAAEHMKTLRRGSIVNVTSIASTLGMPGNPGYVASKGGLRMLTKALATDLGTYDVRVNSLAPGYIRTAMTEASYRDPALNQQRRKHTMLDRWGEPNDLVGATIFLASDASRYVTGQDLFVDGGWTAKGLTE
jgi:NAD(P)-dependent dehydrogenase (short-subunit alcohol dehydrogenase family)